jgi:hypothetical protein
MLADSVGDPIRAVRTFGLDLSRVEEIYTHGFATAAA